MSDFLTRLAHLARGEAAVAQPLLPGRFSPAPDMGLEESIDIGSQQHSEPAPASKTGQAQASTVPETGRLVHKPVSTMGTRGEGPLDSQDDFGPGRQEPADPASIAPSDEPVSSHPHTPLIPGSVQPDVPGPTLPGDDSAGDRGATQSGAMAPLRESSQGLIQVEDKSGPVHSSSSDGPEQDSAVLETLLVKAYPGRQNAPLTQAAEQTDFSRKDTNREPDIHINIGRVEVRAQTAAPQPSPQPARPKPQSSLPLQDYLKRARSPGGRS